MFNYKFNQIKDWIRIAIVKLFKKLSLVYFFTLILVLVFLIKPLTVKAINISEMREASHTANSANRVSSTKSENSNSSNNNQNILHKINQLGHSTEWLRLGHYHKNKNNYKSYITDKHFFLSPLGRNNPVEELKITWEKLQSTDLKNTTHCDFPSRYIFLKKYFPNELTHKIFQNPCIEFESWKKGLNVTGVSLVFSSAYANNPASLFGHTFLRLHSQENYPLLDYSISYSAQVNGQNFLGGEGVFYAILGLFGVYQGRFSIAPYYMKVTEYNNSEGRDLWEYDLQFSPPQIEILVNHLWELYQRSSFDYYFLDENCSFQILSLLEVIHPDWNLLSQYQNSIYVAPKETVKTVAQFLNATNLKSNIISTNPTFRPSLRRNLFKLWQSSSVQTKEEFFLFKNNKINEQLLSTPTLNLLIQYLNFKKHEEGQKFSQNQKEQLRNILLENSQRQTLPQFQLKGPTKTIESSDTKNNYSQQANNRPDWGHNPSSMGLYLGKFDEGEGILFQLRGGFHDLLNNSEGFEDWNEIDVLDGKIFFPKKTGPLSLHSFTFANVKSLYPWHPLDPQISWGLKAEYQQESVKLRASGGLAKTFWDEKILLYSLIGLETRNLLSKYGPVGEFSILYHPSKINFLNHYKVQLQIESFWARSFHENFWELKHVYELKQNEELRLSISRKTVDIGLLYYF